jgi:hypothetical protein
MLGERGAHAPGQDPEVISVWLRRGAFLQYQKIYQADCTLGIGDIMKKRFHVVSVQPLPGAGPDEEAPITATWGLTPWMKAPMRKVRTWLWLVAVAARPFGLLDERAGIPDGPECFDWI